MLRSTFLNRLAGIAGLGFLPVDKIQATRKIYLLQTFVAGFRFHKGMEPPLHLLEDYLLQLRRDPMNIYDALWMFFVLPTLYNQDNSVQIYIYAVHHTKTLAECHQQ